MTAKCCLPGKVRAEFIPPPLGLNRNWMQDKAFQGPEFSLGVHGCARKACGTLAARDQAEGLCAQTLSVI